MSDAPTELKPDTAKPEAEHESGKMSFLDHLDELRKRLLRIAIYLKVFRKFLFYKCNTFRYHHKISPQAPISLIPILPILTFYMKVSFLAHLNAAAYSL
jgi:Sec-independent protein secretion pathway component TatC